MISYFENKLLYLSMASFVFVASFSLGLFKPEVIVVAFQREMPRVSPLPVLSPGTELFPIISAQGAIAVDLTSGVVLYEKNSDLPLLPASTTKIMTALVAMEYFPKNEILKIDNLSVEGQKMRLVKGEQISLDSLLYGLLIYSANDAAEALAQNHEGGRAAFIEAMNAKAKALHLDNTHFANPTGLDEPGHVSTARDMVRLSAIAMSKPDFAEIVSIKEKTVKSTDEKISHHLVSTNLLLGKLDGMKGVKTGWTEAARENLVGYVERDNHKILSAVLGSQDRFGETRELIDWVFENYKWQQVSFKF